MSDETLGPIVTDPDGAGEMIELRTDPESYSDDDDDSPPE
jgi:hypothetical protein